MKKDIRLYNVIFPVWMLVLFPIMWLIVIPANFVVDSLVLIGCMYFLKIDNKKSLTSNKTETTLAVALMRFWLCAGGY